MAVAQAIENGGREGLARNSRGFGAGIRTASTPMARRRCMRRFARAARAARTPVSEALRHRRRRTVHPRCPGVYPVLGRHARRSDSSRPRPCRGTRARVRPAQGEPVALDSSQRCRRVQQALARAGFDPGPVADLKFGPRTRRAIEGWQQANGYAATGELTSGEVEALLAGASRKVSDRSSGRGRAPTGASGEGRLTVSGAGVTYQGSMAGGKAHGRRTETWAAGDRYEGEWREGCFGERDARWAVISTTAAACGFK